MIMELATSPGGIAGYLEGARDGEIRGTRCAKCGRASVTAAVVCASCASMELTPATFRPEGAVVSFTILAVPPEIFLDEAPYAFVIVQLDDGPRCTGWMPSVKRPEDIRIGDRVRFVKTYKPGMVFERISG